MAFTKKNIIDNLYSKKKYIICIFLIILIAIITYLWINTNNENFYNVNTMPANTALANISESNRFYSSIWNNDAKGTDHASSTLSSSQAWSAGSNNANQTIRLELPTVKSVVGVVVAGRNTAYIDQYVKSFSADYIDSSGNTISVDNGRIYNTSLTGSSTDISYITFTNPVNAKSIIIKPITWNSHISMRADLLLSELPANTALANVSESNRFYSSIWNNDAKGTGHASSTLSSSQAWSAGSNNVNQTIRLELPTVKSVVGVVVAGRNTDYIDQYVKSFSADYIDSSGNTISVDNGRIYNTSLTGSSKDISYITFTNPVNAKSIIIKPITWNSHISMRADLLLSTLSAGAASNSNIKPMPQEIYTTTPYFTGPGINSNTLPIPAKFLVKGPNREDVLAISDGNWLKTVVIKTTGNNLNATSFTADTTSTINNYKPTYINNNNTYVGNYLIINKPEKCIYRTYMFGAYINNNIPIEVTNYADGPNGEKLAIILDGQYVKMYVLENNSSSGSPVCTARYYTDTTINNYTPSKWTSAIDNTCNLGNPNGYQMYKSITAYTGPIPNNIYQLKSVNSNKCLFNNSDGRFNVTDCVMEYNDQHWKFIPKDSTSTTFQLKNINSNKCVFNNSDGRFNVSDCVMEYNDQHWKLIPKDSTTFQLKNVNSNKCLFNNSDGRFNVTDCVMEYNDQHWKLIDKITEDPTTTRVSTATQVPTTTRVSTATQEPDTTQYESYPTTMYTNPESMYTNPTSMYIDSTIQELNAINKIPDSTQYSMLTIPTVTLYNRQISNKMTGNYEFDVNDNVGNLNDFMAKNNILSSNVYISPMDSTDINNFNKNKKTNVLKK